MRLCIEWGVKFREEGGDSAMRTFLFFVGMLLFMALGALEVVASRAVPLP